MVMKLQSTELQRIEIYILFSFAEVFNRIIGYVLVNKSLGPVVRVWAGPFPIFFLTTAQAFEVSIA